MVESSNKFASLLSFVLLRNREPFVLLPSFLDFQVVLDHGLLWEVTTFKSFYNILLSHCSKWKVISRVIVNTIIPVTLE